MNDMHPTAPSKTPAQHAALKPTRPADPRPREAVPPATEQDKYEPSQIRCTD